MDLFVTDETVSLFAKEPTAFIIWVDIMLQVSKENAFIPRREYIKKKFGLGDRKFNRAIKFLKDVGLAETFPVYTRGKMTGAQYKFYSLDNAVKNPSPTTTRGAQSKTRAIKENKQPKPISNGVNSECYLLDYSEEIINKKSDFSSLIRFNNSNPGDHKKCFLKHFIGQNTFQTFDDSKDKKRHLSKIYHKYNSMTLSAKNNQGAGIFLTINETDGKGRSKENIIKVRAVFADLDGASLDPVLEYHPSLVVESSPGRYHAYWLSDDVPLDSFTIIQKAIANKFGSDPKVTDLCRVMRIPGYCHCKNEPVLSQILYTSDNKYSFDELKAMFPDVPQKGNPLNHNNTFKINGVHKGQRNAALCKLIGALKKGNASDDEIKEQAYKFAEGCLPPLKKNEVDPVLISSQQWESGNKLMQGKKNAIQ